MTNSKANTLTNTDRQECRFCHQYTFGTHELQEDKEYHDVCQRILNTDSSKFKILADMRMGYFKQGDDIDGCLSHGDNNELDAIRSFKNYRKFLQADINHLNKLIQRLEKLQSEGLLKPGDIEIYGSAHSIEIEGPLYVLNPLCEQKLLYLKYWEAYEFIGMEKKHYDED